LNTDLGELIKGSALGMNLQQLLSFTRQLQVLISAGIPVVQGLEILQDQALDRRGKQLLSQIREKVSGGNFLWEAISQYPKAFPRMYVALVRAGESSGSIDQMLSRLGRYLENIDKLRKMVKGAMTYPIVVISIGAGVITVMLVFVIPRFEDMLKGTGQKLPAPTQFVITLSHFFAANFMYIIAGVGTFVFLVMRYIGTREGKAFLDRLLFKLPLFGPLAQRAGTARFTRTLATLLTSGVNLIEALDICKATIDNAVLEEAVGKIRGEVEAGKTLGMTLGRLNVFPKMAVQMISVGEATGALDKMLEKVADFYEEEVESFVATLGKLIEPIILVVLGGAVAGLMVAMYLPIFQSAGAAGG
jgi:type IV pilus assembly protein PilC